MKTRGHRKISKKPDFPPDRSESQGEPLPEVITNSQNQQSLQVSGTSSECSRQRQLFSYPGPAHLERTEDHTFALYSLHSSLLFLSLGSCSEVSRLLGPRDLCRNHADRTHRV